MIFHQTCRDCLEVSEVEYATGVGGYQCADCEKRHAAATRHHKRLSELVRELGSVVNLIHGRIRIAGAVVADAGLVTACDRLMADYGLLADDLMAAQLGDERERQSVRMKRQWRRQREAVEATEAARVSAPMTISRQARIGRPITLGQPPTPRKSCAA